VIFCIKAQNINHLTLWLYEHTGEWHYACVDHFNKIPGQRFFFNISDEQLAVEFKLCCSEYIEAIRARVDENWPKL